MYKPSAPFTVAMKLLQPTWTTTKGVRQKTFPDPDDGIPINGSFRTFGGTESTVNDVVTIIDTATIDTWYRPEIKADCRVYIEATEETYEIDGSPENIDMRNQWMRIRVRKVGS